MSNHFHVLVEVPERPPRDPSDDELVDHLATLYRGEGLARITVLDQAGQTASAEVWISRGK